MSDEQTFNIRTGPNPWEVKPHPFEESFELFGEEWVIHRRLYGIGYALSHRATGMKVPESERGRAVEAKYHGTAFLTKNQDKIQSTLDKVRTK